MGIALWGDAPTHQRMANLPLGNRNSLRAYECTRRPVCASRAGHRLLDRRQRRVGLAAERFGALAHQSAIAPTATKFRNALKRRDVPEAEIVLLRKQTMSLSQK